MGKVTVTIRGPKSSGKSTLGAYLAGGLMRKGVAVVAHDPGIARRLDNESAAVHGSLKRMAKAGVCIEIVEVETNPTEGSHEESSES